MFSTKCQVQNDRTNREKILPCCQNLQFRMYVAIKTSSFQLRPLLRFLCLINPFYRRYVSCMYNRSNISNISSISNYINYNQLYQLYPTISTISTISNYINYINYSISTISTISTIQPLSANQQNQYKSPVEVT